MALTINAVFQSDGSFPISSDCLNIWYSGFVMELDISLRTLGCSSSGPGDLSIFSVFSIYRMFSSDISNLEIGLIL